jgi:hypothetical protein
MKDITSLQEANSKIEVSHYLVTQIRPKVLRLLQYLRNEGKIGSSLDAYLIWEIPDFDFATIILSGWLPVQLEELFGVSKVHLFATNEEERLDAYSFSKSEAG